LNAPSDIAVVTEQLESESVQLPSDVLSRIDTRVTHTEFDDRTEYITHVLEEVLYEVEQGTDPSAEEDVDEQQVQERLKSLGYLNE
jgi:Arc/MetJ-type ribon-helix-helix transcriptional regulator